MDDNTRVLILGSLPGERSLAAQEYYAHRTNAFWWLMGGVLGEGGLADQPYVKRLHSLRDHRVGLWDVIARADRRGSLDAAIRHATERDLASFATGLPALRAIAFNGGEAARRGRRQLADHAARWTLIDLPSSSAAYAAMPRTAKLATWNCIRDFLR